MGKDRAGMSLELPLDEVFTADLGGRPATYVDADGNQSEIVVRFGRTAADSFGDPGVVNAAPVLWVKSSDVPDISKSCSIIVHYGYLTDESGEVIYDEAGDPIIAENEFTYKVAQWHADTFGITRIFVSLQSV